MAMEKVDHMRDALAARRGKGLDHLTQDTGTDTGEVTSGSFKGIPAFEHDGKVEGTDLGEHEDGIPQGPSPYEKGEKVARTPEIGPIGKSHPDSVERAVKGEKDFKRSDLAPPHESKESHEGVSRSGNGQHLPVQSGVVGSQHEMAPGDVATSDDTKSHLMGNLTEVDIRDMVNRKPRSLVERARQEAFKGKK